MGFRMTVRRLVPSSRIVANADKLIELFNVAKAKPAGAERERFLAEVCGEDPQIGEQIVSLLRAEAADGDSDFLKRKLLFRPSDLVTEKPDDRIGRYKLLRQLGEGGCGVVYLAEQEETMQRRVALKVIRLGMDTKSVIARFEAERQALALMDHPNIAKVLDAGATDAGRPFFVMELVRGIKITAYCDEHHLPTEQRLELFGQVCQAVQHAHQKGIIHRDLKPSNILVTRHDGVAVPKVIDFGIAKATSDQRLTDKTLFTAFEQFIGTPAYMSPEQAEMSGLDIDTRSDIYSLGVLLYELLTGRTPLEGSELLRSGMDEMRRKIREDEPARPSTRLSTMQAGDLSTIAKDRQAEAPDLIYRVRGDLDWIVMKCLEKDRTRRYETASGLAADVKRHLRNEPVTACPPSRTYRFQKFVRRHKTALTAATLIAVVLVLAVIATALQAIRATRAEREQSRLRKQTQLANRQLNQAVASLELQRAESFFKDGDPGSGLAHLAAMLRHDPSNRIAATRLVSALVHRDWAIPKAMTMRHADRVETIHFSPDGRQVLSASRDRTAKIWDADSGKTIAVLEHAGHVSSAEYDANGARVVTASEDGSARIWDAKTGEPRTPPLQHEGKVHWAEFSPDRRWIVTASADGTASLWDAASGTLQRKLRGHTTPVLLARFSPDNKTIVTGGAYGSIRVWDVASGEMIFHVEDRKSPLVTFDLSPDGKRLCSVCRDDTVRLWNLETHTEIPLPMEQGAIVHAAFSPDSRLLVTSSYDTTARLWDADSGQPIGSPMTHDGNVASAHFSPDGQRIVTLSRDHSARIWDVRTQRRICQPLRGLDDFMDADFSPDASRLVLAGKAGLIQVWDLRPRRFTGLEAAFNTAITTVDFSAGGEWLLATAFDGTARVLDVRTLATVASLPHEPRLYLAKFTPDGNRVFTACENNVRFWDWHKGVVIAGPFKHSTRIESVHFDPEGNRMVTTDSNGVAQVWNVATWEPITPHLVHSGLVVMARFSPDGRSVVTASEDHTARIWNAETGEPVTPPLLHNDHVRWADFSPDGKRVVTASTDDTAGVWDSQTGQPVLPPLQHTRLVDKALFSRDGGRIITASLDYTARIWDAGTGAALTPPLKHDYSLAGVSFTSDGESVMTACWNGTLRLWSTEIGQPITESLGPGDWTRRLIAFDPAGRRMAEGGKDSVVRLWHVPENPTPVPEWFLNFAEAIARIRVGDRGQSELIGATQFDAAMQAFRSGQNDFYARLAQWFLADPAGRGAPPL
jgi:WD40 repeat protein/serine/threonine protein kinase